VCTAHPNHPRQRMNEEDPDFQEKRKTVIQMLKKK
jgi:hypothetical protein